MVLASRLRQAGLLACVVLVAACSAAVGSTSSPPVATPRATTSVGPAATVPTATPAPIATPSEPAATPTVDSKCNADDEWAYEIAGWIGSRVAVKAIHFTGCASEQWLRSIDPADAAAGWRTDGALPEDVTSLGITSDGSSVAVVRAAEGLVFGDGVQTRFPLPQDPLGGYWASPVKGGGYVLTGATSVVRIDANGQATTGKPLPSGFVMVAPTSDPARFIVTPTEDAHLAYGLSGTPFRAFLWNEKTGDRVKVAQSARSVAQSPASLAYLELAGGGLVSVQADGKTRAVKLPAFGRYLSPDARWFIKIPNGDAPGAHVVEYRDAATGKLLSHFEGSAGGIAWRGSTAATISDSGSTGDELVLMSGRDIQRIPVPR